MTFARDTKVSLVNIENGLTLKGEVANDAPTVTTIDVKIGGTTQPFSFVRREWRITEIREMPVARGTVIQITKWHSRTVLDHDRSGYVAMLTAGGWHVACDRGASYSRDTMQNNLNSGMLEFEIIYDPTESGAAAQDTGGADLF